MVGPISNEKREAFVARVKAAFVALVGLSAGLITLQGDPTLPVVAGAVLGGLVVGAGLAWFLFPDLEYRDGSGGR